MGGARIDRDAVSSTTPLGPLLRRPTDIEHPGCQLVSVDYEPVVLGAQLVGRSSRRGRLADFSVGRLG